MGVFDSFLVLLVRDGGAGPNAGSDASGSNRNESGSPHDRGGGARRGSRDADGNGVEDGSGHDDGRDDHGSPEDRGAAFREHAEALVASRPGSDLDFSPASLAALDELAAEDDPGRALDGAVEQAFAGYLGEVLRRDFDAEWHENDGWRLVIEGPDGRAFLDPVAVATDCLRGEESFAGTYVVIRKRLGFADVE